MIIVGLLIALLILLLGNWFIITNYIAIAFSWEDLLLYTIVGAIALGIVYLSGNALDKKFNSMVKKFLSSGDKADLHDRKLLSRFGLLLIVLLPLLTYLLALALFAAIDFGLYGLITLSYSPRVPVALVLGLGIVVLGTGYAILVGFYRLLFPPKHHSIGVTLGKGDENKIWKLTKEIAKQIEAKEIDKIVITPDGGIGVYQDGSLPFVLLGKGTRVLEIGIPSIYGLTVGEFSSILTHEYGHFSNRDTQWGAFTYSMGNSLISALKSTPGPMEQKEGERGGWVQLTMALNPAYWILTLYVLLYFKVTNGFSRMREVMADIMAVELYGGETFSEALLKVSTNDAVFSEMIQKKYLSDILGEGKVILNFSKLMGMVYKEIPESNVRDLRKEIVSSAENHSIYDSHPALKTRLEYSKKLNIDTDPNRRPVSILFDNWDKINEEVADIYNQRLITYLQYLQKLQEKESKENES